MWVERMWACAVAEGRLREIRELRTGSGVWREEEELGVLREQAWLVGIGWAKRAEGRYSRD